MATIKEVRDKGSNPNCPSISEMRASQAAGATGKGTAEETYAELQARFGMGSGEGGEDDNSFSSSDGEEYGLAGIL